jgi:hypothetical protein
VAKVGGPKRAVKKAEVHPWLATNAQTNNQQTNKQTKIANNGIISNTMRLLLDSFNLKAYQRILW